MDKNYIQLEINVSDLQVSKTNPRFIQTVIDEQSAIAGLINLEPKKMVSLAKSIIEKGVLPLPFYCFKENNEVVLADGNRRLTVIKILQNPNLIPDSAKTKELIELCKNAEDIILPTTILCVVYDEWSDELFNILDSLHVMDESKSDWTPLAQYRMSSRHGGKKHSWMKTLLFYFDDEKVDAMTNKKADVFRRMFDALRFNKIEILDTGEINAKDAKKKLESFYEGFIKSDKVNTRTSKEEFREKVKQVFIEEESLIPPKYTFELKNDATIYEEQEFDIDKLGLKIFGDKGKIVKYDKSSLIFNFVNPFGQESDRFDSTMLGQWQINVLYDECSSALQFNVVAKVEPNIELESTKVTVKLGNSAFLRKFIRFANNSFNEDVTSKVKIKAATGQTVKLENDILSGDVTEGLYIIQYYFKDEYGECSKTLYVEVTSKEDFSPLYGKTQKTKLLSWGEKPVTINYHNTVSNLINEINNLEFERFPNVISCSCRAILELSYDALVSKGKIIIAGRNKVEFIDRLKDIVEVLKKNISDISNGDPITFGSYHDELNFLNGFDEAKLKALNGKLNSAAHKSGRGVNLNEIEECIRKDISRLVALINQFLK